MNSTSVTTALEQLKKENGISLDTGMGEARGGQGRGSAAPPPFRNEGALLPCRPVSHRVEKK